MPEFVNPEDADTGGDTETEDQSVSTETASLPTVQFMDENKEVPVAVQEMAHILESPEHFGLASGKEVRELRKTVEQQQKAIAELAELVDKQSQVLYENGLPAVRLDAEPLDGIYDPTEEFDD